MADEQRAARTAAATDFLCFAAAVARAAWSLEDEREHDEMMRFLATARRSVLAVTSELDYAVRRGDVFKAELFEKARALVQGDVRFEQLERLQRGLLEVGLEDLGEAIRTACGQVDDEYVRACWGSFESNRFGYVVSRRPKRQGELLLERAYAKLAAKERVGG